MSEHSHPSGFPAGRRPGPQSTQLDRIELLVILTLEILELVLQAQPNTGPDLAPKIKAAREQLAAVRVDLQKAVDASPKVP